MEGARPPVPPKIRSLRNAINVIIYEYTVTIGHQKKKTKNKFETNTFRKKLFARASFTRRVKKM